MQLNRKIKPKQSCCEYLLDGEETRPVSASVRISVSGGVGVGVSVGVGVVRPLKASPPGCVGPI